jgi:toxin-antitoxin system PIN domain toxin
VILPDINILLPALRDDLPDHASSVDWLRQMHESGEPFALADIVVAGIIRISTNPRAFKDPATTEDALLFVDDLVAIPGAVMVSTGPRYWPIFKHRVSEGKAAGRLVPDAHLAAIATEHGCRIATRDRDFARFPGLDWFDPFER